MKVTKTHLILAAIFSSLSILILSESAICEESSNNHKFTLFPRERSFHRKLADPREVQLSARFLFERDEFAGNIGYSVGFFEFYLKNTQIQFRVEGNTFLVSKVQTPDFPVQSTDYTIAFPLDLRTYHFSARFRWTHISSHLGDDFNKIDNISDSIEVFGDEPFFFSLPKKFSREFLELFGSYDFYQIRFYGGAIWAYHITPNPSDRLDSKPWTLQFGLEWQSNAQNKLVHPFAAVDLRSQQEFDWRTDYNIQLGLIIGNQKSQRMRLALEFFNGRSNQGQFFQRQQNDINVLLAFDF